MTAESTQKSILIIDDEIFARDHLARLIEKQGFQVFSATTGEEGIQLFREKRPNFVFLDILLPGIDGEDVFNYLRDIDPKAHVYFITGCDDIVSREQARAMGARGFLTKPIFFYDVLKLTDILKSDMQPSFYNSEE